MSGPEARDILTGIPASPGLAVGRVCFWSDPESVPRYPIPPDRIKPELERFDRALESSRQQLRDLRQRVEKELGEDEAAIFSSHQLLLDDPAFYAKVEKKLISETLNLEAAVEDVIEELVKVFRRIPDAYLREKGDDYRDVGRRVMDNLLSYQRQCTLAEGEVIILVARELMPSDTVHFHRQHIGAFVTERGGVSSHAAILARSMRLPAVVGTPGALSRLPANSLVLVDGNLGKVVIAPTEREIARAREDATTRAEARGTQRLARPVPTRDGVEVTLLANLTREAEAEEARQAGALGVGLLRTEFLFMDRGEFLDEEGQVLAYRHVVEVMAPLPVIIRTLDLGEDKQFNFENPVEPGAACVLGWRSLRLSLANQAPFLAQLRAILRAAVHGTVRMLLPMVTGVEDLRRVRGLMRQAADDLRARGARFVPEVPVGAMIETPAAALVPELLLREADFLSVGTNDLVQYLMVADRVSERMQPYYRPTAPAVLSALHRLAGAARAAGKEVSICGEIAGDPLYLPLLLGLGFRTLSAAPVLLPDLAEAIARTSLAEAEALARRALSLATADEVEALLHQAGSAALRGVKTA
jgi:phosphoenolpyruvate-protein phosphotransferase (PTS system enzyme I)